MITVILSTATSLIIFLSLKTENLTATLPDFIAYIIWGAMVGLGFGVVAAILIGYKSQAKWSKWLRIKV